VVSFPVTGVSLLFIVLINFCDEGLDTEVSEKHAAYIFRADIHLQDYMESQARRPQFEQQPPNKLLTL
jgi:hypothetical protein